MALHAFSFACFFLWQIFVTDQRSAQVMSPVNRWPLQRTHAREKLFAPGGNWTRIAQLWIRLFTTGCPLNPVMLLFSLSCKEITLSGFHCIYWMMRQTELLKVIPLRGFTVFPYELVDSCNDSIISEIIETAILYSETWLLQTAWGCPNLFVISGVCNNQEINSLI